MKTRIASGAVLIVCIWFTSCKDGPSPFQKSPSEVVKAYYRACNDGKYSEAKAMFSEDEKKLVDGDLGQLAGGLKGICDTDTRNGTVTEVDITSQTIRGEGATVIDTVAFKDGSKKTDDKTSFILENGSWKLAPGGN